VRITGTYYYKRRLGGSVGYFATTGSTDALRYAPGETSGVVVSANGSPDTKGWIAELSYAPLLNTKLSAQFTRYSKFNGSRDNYDGFGRNASDNDSVYLLLWFAY
jgi:hypothetical protein